jgi:23S rRNA pseudouridine1911/1915/1917 synthase
MAAREEGDEPRVVREDGGFVVVYKPPRMHCAPGLGSGDLCSWMQERYPETAGPAGAARPSGEARRRPEEGYLLHRLDYETSGLVLYARDGGTYARLLEEQEAGRFRKEYFAFCAASRNASPSGSAPVRGMVPGVDEAAWASARDAEDAQAMLALLGGEVRFLRSAFRPFGPRGARVACLLGARAAGTTYVTEILGPADQRYTGVPPLSGPPGLICLRLRLSRGFRHQIRAHLAWIGLPISGDPLYGGAADGRLGLYATALEFALPGAGRAVRITLDQA